MFTQRPFLAALTLSAAAALAAGLAAPASAAPNVGTSNVSLPDGKLRMTLQVISSHSAPAGNTSPNALVLNHSAIVAEQASLTFSGHITGGSMIAGYLVGCQVNLSSGLNVGISPNVGFSGNYTPGVPSDDYAGPSANLGGTVSMSLIPGQATSVAIINAPLTGATASPYQVAHSATPLNLSQCGGRASAVPFVTATINSSSGTLQTTAYGSQFDF